MRLATLVSVRRDPVHPGALLFPCERQNQTHLLWKQGVAVQQRGDPPVAQKGCDATIQGVVRQPVLRGLRGPDEAPDEGNS